MRPIIIFMTSLAPTGGIERDALKCIRALLNQGREIHLGVAFLHPEVCKELQGNIHWHGFNTVKRPPAFGQFLLWRQMLKLERRIKEQSPDAKTVCFEWMPVCDYQVGGQPPRLWWQARKAMGLPTLHRPAQRLWEQFVERQLFRRGTHFAVYSNLAQEAFEAIGLPRDRVERVIIPTDLETFRPRMNQERNDILIIGSNPMLKGIDLALHAWTVLHRRYPKLQLNIVAKGWKVERLVRRSGLPRVRISPLIPDPQQYYDRARLVWAPSRFETWCNVVPEALACGLPVITSSQTPASELVSAPWMGAVIERTTSLDQDADILTRESALFLDAPLEEKDMQSRHQHIRMFQDAHLDTTQWITRL